MLASDDIQKYLPGARTKPYWEKRKCPFPDCKIERVFKKQAILKAHLKAKKHWKKSGHGLSTEEAESKAQEMRQSDS